MNSTAVGANAQRCATLLNAALESVDAAYGALYAIDSSQIPRLLSWNGDPSSDRLELMAQAAGHGLGASQAVRIAESRPTDAGRSGASPIACLVAPAVLEGQAVALVVASGFTSGEPTVESFADRLEPLAMSIGMSVERLNMLEALERREQEIDGLRRQLDVYATDFRSTYRAERDRSAELAEALAELQKTYGATVRGLAVAVEAKDECTGGHLQRVSRYGMMLTALVAPGHAEDPQFEYGFLLHDIGKLTVPDEVLLKPGALTGAEWALIREHPASGHSILDGIPFLTGAREIVYSHHERWDGCGYPRGLAGADIPLGAQIFPLCDAFDAMTSDRPYRKAFPIEEARAEIAAGAGSQFWPDAVEAFLSLPVVALESVRADNHGDLR